MSAKQRIRPGLGKHGARFCRKILAHFEIFEEHDLTRLHQASRCLDHIAEAESVLEREGLYILDRFGQTREHPALKSIRDFKTLFLRIIREIGLDVHTAGESRPPGLY